MTHQQKVEYFLEDLTRMKINPFTAAPPIYQLLWRCGVEIRPPLFAGFWAVSLFMGTGFGLCFGLALFFLPLNQPTLFLFSPEAKELLANFLFQPLNLPPAFLIIESVVSGVVFGIASAFYYTSKSRKLSLPRWEDYPNR